MFNSLRIGKRVDMEETTTQSEPKNLSKKSTLSSAAIRVQTPIWQKFSDRKVFEDQTVLRKQREETRNKIIAVIRKIVKTISHIPY